MLVDDQLINLRKLFYYNNDLELFNVPYLCEGYAVTSSLSRLTKKMDATIEEVNSFF